MHYEDLIGDPTTSLTELCRFLGEDFDAAMLHHEQAAGEIVPAWKSWHSLTHAPVDHGRVAAWRTGLSRDEIGLVEHVAERSMRRYGYEPSGDGVAPSRSALARFAADHARRDLYVTRQRLKDAMLRRTHPHDVGDPVVSPQ